MMKITVKKMMALIAFITLGFGSFAEASGYGRGHHEERYHSHHNENHRRQCTTTEQSTWLPLAEVMMKAETDGYRLRKAKVKRSCYEVEIEKGWSRIKKYYDPSNGTLVHSYEK